MKYIFTSLLIFLTPFLLRAQSSYKPGYVVTLQGDTIKGLINNDSYEKNLARVSILRGDNAQTSQYSIINALAFGINGRFAYQRSVIWVSQDEPGANTTNDADTTQKLDTVFLKVLVTGKNASLYSYTDRIKARFYLGEGNSQPVELVYHEYRDPNQQDGTITKALYKIQLQKLAAKYQPGNEKLVNSIQTSDYKDYALTPIIFAINGSQAVQVSQPKKSGMRFFAGVNMNAVTTSYNSSASSDDLNGVAPQHSVSPQANIGVDFFFDKEKQLFVFRVALGFSTNKVSLVNNYEGDYAQPDNRYTEALKFNHFDVSLTPQIILNIYNSARFKFYVDGGLSVTNLNYSDKSYTNTIYYSSLNETTYENQVAAFPTLHSLIINVPVKAGFVINNRIDIYAGYTPRTDLSSIIGISLAQYSYQAGINYLFGK